MCALKIQFVSYLTIVPLITVLSVIAESCVHQKNVKITLKFVSILLYLTIVIFDYGWLVFSTLILCLFLEFFIPRNGESKYSSETLLSIGLTACDKIILIPVNLFLLDYLNRTYLMPENLGLASLGVPLLFQLIIYVVVSDFKSYWIHTLEHRISLFWRIHRVHHGMKDMSSVIGFRQHPIYVVANSLSQIGIACLLGISTEVYFMQIIMVLMISVFYNHLNINCPRTDQNFPWWGYLVSTPNFHSWHHTVHCRKNTNLSDIFPVWDLVFGTFEIPQGDPSTWQFGCHDSESYSSSLYGEMIAPFCRSIRSTN